jgi:S-adenosylmethionine-dependent methyltransferase
VHAIVVRALAEIGPAPLSVVDAGGGTGGLAVPLAVAGHRVTVVDPSPDSLAASDRRAAEAGVGDRITGVQGDLDDLPRIVAAGSADAVLCHRVLEFVDDRDAALAHVSSALRPGGLASLLVANRLAQVVQRALAGRFAEATEALRPHPAPGPVDRAELEELVTRSGLVVQQVHGVRVVSDLVPGALLDDPEAVAAVVALEQAAAEHPALREVATQLHVLARKPV